MLVACATASAQDAKSAPKVTTSRTSDATIGKRIYSTHGCYACHGGEGQGSVLSGPRIGQDPMPFAAFVQYLRQPSGQMPPYTIKVMSDSDLANIYAFLKSLPKPVPPEQIRLLSQ